MKLKKITTNTNFDEILAIRNQIEIRKQMINPDIINTKTNVKWWNKMLMSRNFEAWQIIFDNKVVGVISLIKRFSGWEIDIYIEKEHQNKGVGLQALKKVIKSCNHKLLIANVKPNNMASQRLFEKAGFIKMLRYEKKLEVKEE